jgi:bifunctional oligoribonuclease and PAP phosphatase NrnA
MVDVTRFSSELEQLEKALAEARRVLITAPGAADGDSIGAQLALRLMIMGRYPKCEARILNDEPLPERYLFLPDVEHVDTPETFATAKRSDQFDVAIVVDGGVDRAGRVKEVFGRVKTRVFIDHHAISAEYPYEIKIVEPTASSTTELMYHLSQTKHFKTNVSKEFSQQIYLGLIFDTGFFRHSNTTPEVMELAAKLLRSGFDFTRVGERGMLERSFASLQLLSDTLSRAELKAGGKIIFSTLSQANLRAFRAQDDDREGIIDHLFLTHGIEVALLFFELPHGRTKVSLRSQGDVDVADFARNLTEQGGGHIKAAGANLALAIEKAVPMVLERLEKHLAQMPKAVAHKH